MSSTAVIATTIPTIGVCFTAAVTYFTTKADRDFRLDVSSHERVQGLMEVAQNREKPAAERIGVIHLLESLAVNESRIRPAVYGFVDALAHGHRGPEDSETQAVEDVAMDIRGRLAQQFSELDRL